MISDNIILRKKDNQKIFNNLIAIENRLNTLNENFNKEMNEIKNDLKNLLKIPKKFNKSKLEEEKYGIVQSTKIPLRIKESLKIKEDFLARTSITKKIFKYIDDNNLKGFLNHKNKIDNRIYHVDETLSYMFNLTQEEIHIINNSNNCDDKNAFNFYTMQTWIKKIYDN